MLLFSIGSFVFGFVIDLLATYLIWVLIALVALRLGFDVDNCVYFLECWFG